MKSACLSFDLLSLKELLSVTKPVVLVIYSTKSERRTLDPRLMKGDSKVPKGQTSPILYSC